MILKTFHISENSTSWDEGWGATPATSSLQFIALTNMKIKSISIRVGCNTSTYDVTGNFYILIDNTQIFADDYILYADDGNSQWVNFNPNITINSNNIVNIYTEVGSGRQARAYYGTSGDFPIGIINNPTSAAEMILDVEYNPIWTIDEQNNGYPYPIDTDPTEFTEFTKDKDGYSTNLGTWKLDENNEGYPWVTGFPLIRREALMKFINDTGLNYLVQKINSIFRVDSHNDIRHDDLNVRKLDAQKIDINGATRIETTNSGVIKLGRIRTDDGERDTSALSILGDQVTVKNYLDSRNIKSRWMSHYLDGNSSLFLSYYSESETNGRANGYPHLKLEQDRIVISGSGDKGGSEYNSSYITVDGNDSKIKLTSDLLSVHSDNIVIHNKVKIEDYLNVITANMCFRASNGSIGMYTYSDMHDSELDGEKIRLSNKGLITLCGRDWISIGIGEPLSNLPSSTSTFYETIVAHYGFDERGLLLMCPNSNVTLQLETDKAYYKKTNATRTANDEIATIGDISTSLSGYIPNAGNTTAGTLTLSRSGNIGITSTGGDITIQTTGTGKKVYYGTVTANNEIATIGDITSRIQESDAMQYKGSINASADLPTVSNTTNNLKVGATYKVATAGTYSYYNGTSTVTQACKVGDLFIAKAIASGTTKTITWDYIPAADDVLSLSYITSGTPTISTTAQTGTSLTLGSVVTKMVETTLTNTDANVPTSKAVQTYVSGVAGGYIPNEGNEDGNIDLGIVRSTITLISGGDNAYPQIYMDGDGVKLQGDETNTFVSVGQTATDEVIISANGAVKFVTDSIMLQADDTDVTIGGDTDIKIYAGHAHNLNLESTTITNIKGGEDVIIYAPDTITWALHFSTEYDVEWFTYNATLNVHGSSIDNWDTFADNVLANNGSATQFVFDIANTTINIAANTIITNTNDDGDFDNVLRIVNCTFNITNGSTVMLINGGHVEFENCRFVAPNYVNNKVKVAGTVYAVFKNCTFENVDIECAIIETNSVFIIENCYCSHGLTLTPTVNPNAPIKIMNSYFDTATITTPTGQTDVNAIIAGCRFSPNTSLSNVRRSWNNTLY